MPSATNGRPHLDVDKVAEEAESMFRRALDDVKRGSTYKQLGWGAAAGWYVVT